MNDQPVTWDWNLPNQVIAKQVGIPQAHIATIRRCLGKPLVYKYAHVDTSEWDWEQPDSELARQNGLEIIVVRSLRRLRGMPKPKFHASKIHAVPLPPEPNIDWGEVDWNLSDVAISKIVGRTRERVRQKRAALGFRRVTTNQLKYETFLNHCKGRKEMTKSDLKSLGIALETGKGYCRRSGIEYTPGTSRKQTTRPWQSINFQLPNWLLVDIWDVLGSCVSNRRRQWKIGDPVFRTKNGRIPTAYTALVEAETDKATAFFKKHPDAKRQRGLQTAA